MWRGQNESKIAEEKRNGRVVGAAETSKERAEWRRLQQRNLSILGLLKRKEWPRYHRKSSWQIRQGQPCQKKRNGAVSPEYQIMRSEIVKRGEREKRIRARAWRGKGGLHGEGGKIPRRKGKASKKSLPRTSRRKNERVSGRKSSPGQSAESWFHSKSGQT